MVRSVLLEEAARLLGVSRRTVYNRIRDGRLVTVRTPGGSQRVLVDSIAALLRERAGPSVSRVGKPETESIDRASSGRDGV